MSPFPKRKVAVPQEGVPQEPAVSATEVAEVVEKPERVILTRDESLKAILPLKEKAKKDPAWNSHEMTIMNNKGAIHRVTMRLAYNLIRYDGAQLVNTNPKA